MIMWQEISTWRGQKPWSIQSADGRFVITETSTGYNLLDRRLKTLTRLHTIQVAKAIAGTRAGGDAPIYRSESHLQ